MFYSNGWMTDHLLLCLYSASASCNNQSEMSVAAHDIRKFQTKLRSIEAFALISALGISIINDNSRLLGYNNPSARYVTGLIYTDHMIMCPNSSYCMNNAFTCSALCLTIKLTTTCRHNLHTQEQTQKTKKSTGVSFVNTNQPPSHHS